MDYLVPDEDKYRVNETIMKEREKLIKFNQIYIKKHKHMPPTSLEFYEYTELIGKGAFGKVTLGIHKLTGRYVAIKAIDKAFLQDTYSKKKVLQEVYILKKIAHQNVIRLFEVFETPKHVLLVMEYAGGGLAHCHCRSVLHRDIKLDNILMDSDGGIKICDFGVSRLITKNQVI